jgi:hypothetical protein
VRLAEEALASRGVFMLCVHIYDPMFGGKGY